MNPKHLRYTENHEWIRDDGGVYVVGITDYAVEQLGDVTFVELPRLGETFDQGDQVATVESVKAASEVYAPVGGTVVAINNVLDDHPEIINKSPYDSGWFLKMEDIHLAEYDELMTAEQYDTYLKSL